MRAEIKALHQRLKTTTVYVTHDQVEAMTMADKIVVMQDGRIEQIGSPLELYDRPNNLFVAQFIGSPAMNVVTGTLRRQGGQAWVEGDGDARWPVEAGGPGVDGQAVHLRRAARAPVGRRTGRLGPGRGDRRRADRCRDRAAGPGRRIADRAGAARPLGGRSPATRSASRSRPARSTCSIRPAVGRSRSRNPRAAQPSGLPSRYRWSLGRRPRHAALAACAGRPGPC